MKLTIDFETRSAGPDIKNVGSWEYSCHPTTNVLCLAFKVDDQPTQIWVNGDILPMDFEDVPYSNMLKMFRMLYEADTVEAHNAFFEKSIYNNIMIPRYDAPRIPPRKWRCSAAKAAAASLPRALQDAGAALGLNVQKDNEGHRIMLKLCKPRPAYKPNNPKSKQYFDDREDFHKLMLYCVQDVEAEHALSMNLRDLSDDEQELWFLDQEINLRGVPIDRTACNAIVNLIAQHETRLLAEMEEITSGVVKSPKQVAAMRDWMKVRGVGLSDLQKQTVIDTLAEDDLPADVRRVLEIRQSLSKSSTAKYRAMLDRSASDGRVRDTLMYHGAGPGRWAARGIQVQNFPRGTFTDVGPCVDLCLVYNAKEIELFYGDPMEAFATCIRSMISAPDGKDFICADFSSIEARVLAWQAGQQDVLDSFIRGLDLYKVAATSIYHKKYEDITKDERQIGKVAVLALGYAGGVKAFQSMAVNYGVIMDEVEIQAIVDNWRAGNKKIVDYWYATERVAKEAIISLETTSCGFIRWRSVNNFLYARLPSGRLMAYYDPRVECIKTPWGEREAITFMGVNSVTRKWERQSTYGGKLVENLTQAIARDLMAEAMKRLDKAGYKIVMTVHDEILAEVEEGEGSLSEFCDIMSVVPAWAFGCPIEADGWRGKRFRK